MMYTLAMSIFLITPIAEPAKVAASVKANFADDCYPVSNTQSLLVHYSGTTKELSDKLGISTGENGTGIIVSFSSYYGRAPTDIWEWIKSRLERD